MTSTFGCGEFLPGKGPFNFPDYIEGGGGIGGPDPPVDPPTRTDAGVSDPPIVTDPGGGGLTPLGPRPGAPSGPGVVPGPGTGGPFSPGAPGGSPTNRICRCVIKFDAVNFLPPTATPDGGERWSGRFPQVCRQLPAGSTDTNDADATAYILSLFPNAINIRREGAGISFADCNTNTIYLPKCNGACSILRYFWDIPGEGPGGPISPSPVPPDPPGPGPTQAGPPVISPPAPPADPPNAGPPSVVPNNDPGNIGPQSPISPGPVPPDPPGPGPTQVPPSSARFCEITAFVPQSGGNALRRVFVASQACAQKERALVVANNQVKISNQKQNIRNAFPPPAIVTFEEEGEQGKLCSIGSCSSYKIIANITYPQNSNVVGVESPTPDPGVLGFDPVPDDGGGGGNGGGSITPLGNFVEEEAKQVSNLTAGVSINLSDTDITRDILSNRPTGFEDEEVFFNETPRKGVVVGGKLNVTTDIFDDLLDSNVSYLINNQSTFGDWDSRVAAGLTPASLYNSLNNETKYILSQILNYDNTPISINQIYNMIGTRILDGTVNKITKGSLRLLAKGSDGEEPLSIVKSSSDIVNETVALGLVEKNFYPLDATKSIGRAGETLKNRKVLSTDVDRFIDLTIRGEETRLYINDDETFIEGSPIKLEDGEYFEIFVDGEKTRIYAESEIDHAFLVPEKTRQIALGLLGGDKYRTLTVSGDPEGIEIDYSLSAPRKNIYFLSCVLDTISTNSDLNNTSHVKKTTARYNYVELDNIDEINEYIKYKNNHHSIILDDEDLILDYVERDGHLYLTQDDILLDSPKENKTNPLLTRQLPWYILLYPTNRPEYNPFNGKSQIVNIDNVVTRQLRTSTSIVPEFRNSYNQLVSTELVGRGARDVYDNPTNQARINKINLDNKLINSGYVDSTGNDIAAATYVPNRSKTGYRLLVEIVKELDTNYLLGLNGIGKSITEFDLLSRLNFKQFNLLSRVEGFKTIKQTIYNGSVNNVKVTPATKNSDARLAIRKTQLVRRKSTAPEVDQYPEVKATNFHRAIKPPTTDNPSEFISFEPAKPPTALP